MFDRRSLVLSLLLSSLAASACDCGGEPLLDARARLTVEPQSLDFGNVVRGQLRAMSVVLENKGSLALKITQKDLASMNGEFAFISVVPDGLAPQDKATVNLTYEPQDLGEDLGTLTLKSDDGNEAIVVSLRGVGVEAAGEVALSGERCGGEERSISFGNIRPGATGEQTITVKSAGGAPLTVLSAIIEANSSNEWSIDAGALPKTLAADEELAITVRYAPIDGGADQAVFVITTDAAASSTFRIAACGAGVAPALCGRPIPLNLGAVPAGQSVSGTLTLESCGLEPLELTAIALGSDPQHPTSAAYRLRNVPALPMTLAPGATTDVEITFDAAPPATASRGWIQVSSNAYQSPENYFPVDVTLASPCQLFVAPDVLNYRNIAVGSSGTHSVLIGNSGDTACDIAALEVTTSSAATQFSLGTAPGTPFSIPAAGAETIEVVYSPTDANPHEGELAVVDAAGARLTVALHGNPPAPTGCAIEAQPSLLTFGVTPVGTTAHLAVRIVNIGEDPCRVTMASLVNGDPALSVTLPVLTIAFPGFGGVDVDVAYAPNMAGGSSDVLRVEAQPLGMGTGGGTVFVGINANAADARICVMPASVDFGMVTTGSSRSRAVTISSCGAVELDIRGILLSPSTGTPFTITGGPQPPLTVPAGLPATPDLQITYAPMNAGPHFAQVEILSSDHSAPSTIVPLVGNWDGVCSAVLSCTPAAFDFGDTEIGTSKLLRGVCRSLGNDPVTITGASLSGNGPELTLAAALPVTVQPGDSWTYDVFYEPVAELASSASVNIQSTACIAPPAIPVSGNGIVRDLPPCLPPSTFSPVVQWHWQSTTYEPTYINVWSTPLVANLNDDNGDSVIDENDIPEVVFISFDTYSITDPAASIPGVLRVLNGATGAEEFSVMSPRFADTSLLAIGDLDADGRPEIIGSKWIATPPGTGAGNFFGRYSTGTLVALDNTGRLLWESDPWTWPQEVTWNSSAPSIVDLDGDGYAEIVLGREVFSHQGRRLWSGTGDHGQVGGGVHSIAADIDLDGRPEILAGGTIYSADGTVLMDIPSINEGGNAVGMLDPLDPFPQIALFSGAALHVINHLGVEQWAAPVNAMAPTTQLPSIADFDGDGDGDVAIANGEFVYVYEGTGALIWNAPVSDSTCCVGISAFDFEGDGAYELILTDYGTVYVFRGSDGTLMYSAPRPSPTAYEMPVVADIDNDGKGELLVANLGAQANAHGIVAYSNVGDTWVGAPRIWNQQAYHVTNVYENGAIPRVMTPWPQGPNVYRGTIAACE